MRSQESDDVVVAEVHVAVLQTDALAGCRLSGQRDVRIREYGREVHDDEPRHVEHDGAWPLHLSQTVEQRARCGLVAQVGYVIYCAAAPSFGKAAVALGTRKGQLAGLKTPHRGIIFLSLCIHLFHLPVIGVHAVEPAQRVRCIGKQPLVLHVIDVSAYEEMVLHGLVGLLPCECHRSAVAVGMNIIVGRVGV